MTISLENIVLLLLAYLLGSIPTSVWVGQIFYKTDVREYGSGNAGATNTFRVLGPAAGVPVLIFDIFKGWLAVKMPFVFAEALPGSIPFINLQLVLGVAALIGHIFPVYVGFRGGKGIATLLGIVLAMHLHGALVAIGVFVIMLFASNYVSLSSIIASLAFPVYVIIIEQEHTPTLIIFSLFITILVLITHQKNIERLLRNEESKVFKKNKSSSDE